MTIHITPTFDPRVGRIVTEADVVWEEVDELVERALQFTDRDDRGKWYFTDIGQFQQVVAEAREWNPAAQQAFALTLEKVLNG